MMRKTLTFMAGLTTVAVISPSVVSCSQNVTSSDSNDMLEPSNGWPPIAQDFLPVWKKFREQLQTKVSKSSDNIRWLYSFEYQNAFDKYQNINREFRNKDGYDRYGVPNEVVNDILADVAISDYMYDYQKNSVMLYYVELNVSYLETGVKQVNGGEEENVWAMKYFRAYPFYEYVEMTIRDPNPVMYSVPINYDFYSYYPYIPYDKAGNPDWRMSPNKNVPKGTPAWDKFKTSVHLKKEYWKLADRVYDELFGGDSND